MDDNRTRAWWLVRIELAAGIGTSVLVGLVILAAAIAPPCFGCERQEVMGFPADVLTAAFALALASVGLVWMLRIRRGPSDEPPPWRYRDY